MSAPVPPITFDDVVLDLAGRRLRRGGVDQPLEPKAFAVLALLAGAPGQVLTRDAILDAVWGHRHVTPGVLNRVMTLLRHALGEEANAPHYLRTLHGIGYRFDMPEPIPAVKMPATPAPEPEKESVDVQRPMRRAGDGRRTLARWTSRFLPVLALLALAAWLWWPRALPAPPAAPAPRAVPVTSAQAIKRSIAVLPLANASNDKQQQFFSDGLSENLINALSRFEGLKVIGRDSAFLFRDSKDDSRTIGRKLGVSYLLSGSVQHAGDIVRINASLTNAADGSTLWAEHYDRPYKDLFALQDEIASSVASALQARLLPTPAAATPDDRPPGGNIHAYSAFLQGMKSWHEQDFLEAAEYMSTATQLDPAYAMAWAHLSGSWSTAAVFGSASQQIARDQIRKAGLAADRALQLAPGLGSAHAARAYLQFYRFDYRGALVECRRAVQLAPGDSMVLNGCGYTLAGIGKLGEAIRLRERLLSIEPLYYDNYLQYAALLMETGRLDEATKYLRIAEALSQPHSPPTVQQMRAAILRGDAQTAQDVAREQALPWRDMSLAVAAQVSPDRAAADAALAHALATKAWANTSPYLVAQAYALRDDPDRTMEWLERAPARDILFVLADPVILRFRNDPRFIAFCKKTGLPPPSESEALGIDQIRATLAAQ